MRVAALVGVWNEVELAEQSIRHLRGIGVEFILVCDMYSTDGTAEILASLISDTFGVMKIGVEEPGEVYLQKCADAAKRLDADWVLLIDADEFVLPSTGDIRDCPRLVDADIISLRSYNVVCTSSGPLLPKDVSPAQYGEVQLIVQDLPNFREQLSSNHPPAMVRMMWPPKVMVRREQLHKMIDGNHDVVTINSNSRRATAKDLIIAHLFVTTRTRFLKKMESIRETFIYQKEYLVNDKAWHWRYLLSLQDAGDIDQEFRRSIFTAEQLSQLRAEGVVKTAAEVLASSEFSTG
jgi:glycosyltransferase involved in cell wall biosynthesis